VNPSGFKLNRSHWLLFLALIVAAGLRLAVVAIVADYPDRYANFDGAGYDQLAWNLVQHGQFAQGTDAPFVPDNYRTPLYPAYVAVYYWILGHQPVAVLISQALIIDVATCLLVFVIAKRLFNPTVAVVAALLFALSPISIDYASLLWSDTLFTLCLILAVWRLLVYLQTWRWREILSVAVLLGIATLVHPRSLLLPLAIVPIILAGLFGWYGHGQVRARTLLTDSAIFVAVFAMVLTPWMLRNYATFGVVNIASSVDLNLLTFNAGALEADRTGTRYVDAVAKLDQEVTTTTSDSTENQAAQAAAARQVALEKILGHPFEYLITHLKGVIPVLSPGARLSVTLYGVQPDAARQVWSAIQEGGPDRLSQVRSLVNARLVQETWPELADALFLVVTYGFGIWGVISLRRSPWGWLLLIVVLYLVLLPGPAGAPRYRVPAVPYMVVLAAVGMASAARLVRRSRSQATLVASQYLPGLAMTRSNATVDRVG
jgi:4-amino-4-deoxy-L-arabinose transferase-like glycosyltransferase